MPLPVIFSSLPSGDNPAALLDTQFNALAGFTTIPCLATVGGSANQLELQPFEDAPVVTAMDDLAPAFAFVAPAASTGNVTANVAGLGEFPVYKNNGATLVTGGDIAAGGIYTITFSSTLDGGAGGFVIDLTSLSSGPITTLPGPLAVGPVPLPVDTAHDQVIANGFVADLGGGLGGGVRFNCYYAAGAIFRYLQSGPAATLEMDSSGTVFLKQAISGTADAMIGTLYNALTIAGPSGQAQLSGPLGVGPVTPPSTAALDQVFTNGFVANLGGGLGGGLRFNCNYVQGAIFHYFTTGPAATLEMDNSGTLFYKTAASGAAGNVCSPTTAMTIDGSGHMSLPLDTLAVSRNPAVPLEVATKQYVDASVVPGGVTGYIWIDRNNVDQALADNTTVKVQFSHKVSDPNGVFDATTNYRYTPTVAGKYLIDGQVGVGNPGPLIEVAAAIYKNGSKIAQGTDYVAAAAAGMSYFASRFSAVCDMNGTTDYIEIFIFSQDAAATNTSSVNGGATNTYLTAIRLGA